MSQEQKSQEDAAARNHPLANSEGAERVHTQYWVVGASFRDDGDEPYVPQDEWFVSNGVWMLGYPPGEKTIYDRRTAKMQVGDRIAIKRMMGKAQPTIRILHIGIIRDLFPVEAFGRFVCSVNWVCIDLDRTVQYNGCGGSLHGPYTYDDRWTRQVFSL